MSWHQPEPSEQMERVQQNPNRSLQLTEDQKLSRKLQKELKDAQIERDILK